MSDSLINKQDAEYLLIKHACQNLPPSQGNYLESDFVSNLLLTVLDYQQKNITVSRAYDHYKYNHWNQIRSLEGLKIFLLQYSDDKDGNTDAAVSLWGYRFWTRLAQLRRLMEYFESIDITDQDSLKIWAETGDFKSSFKGKVKGLGPTIYRWLLMRVGIETVKPDTHVLRFLQRVTGRKFSGDEAVVILEQIAKDIGKKAYELDWAIWEYQRGKPGTR